ncbi:DNA-directed RNA polymerase [Handroanthus impetiginosus]|uniref:DNA-directed RNA polymerase subunit n=1 Tax=Handroanthus impetiginosus TaxID=429701 RepID=A0A2G9G0C3_9LAMI|nr:DNA-directed RNA polymerase [Handroanthus impetiginosus]
MVLCLLPVLPPELRPIIQINGGKLMRLDINELYRRVIYWNNTFVDLLTTSRPMPGELVMCQKKLIQEAMGVTLLDNGIHGQPMMNSHNKVYKSFSDVIEGKELTSEVDSTNRAKTRGWKVSRHYWHLKGNKPLVMGHKRFKKRKHEVDVQSQWKKTNIIWNFTYRAPSP